MTDCPEVERDGGDSFPTGPGRSPTISIDRLTVCRGQREVLRDLNLSFAEKTITVLVGPSGVGKTTLVGLLNGLIHPARGRVHIAGFGDLGQPETLIRARRATATVFQDHALIGRLSAIDNVLLGLADQCHPLSPFPWTRSRRLKAAATLNEVGLLDRATTRCDRLSGGERQRVGIARALVREPRLLLADEPFASVDVSLAARLGQDIRRLVVEKGLTAILVLHQLTLARQLADRIVGLANGGVVFDGPARTFDDAAERLVFGKAKPAFYGSCP